MSKTERTEPVKTTDVLFYELGQCVPIKLTSRAAERFRKIIDGDYRTYSDNGLNPVPLGYFEVGQCKYCLVGPSIVVYSDDVRKVWIDNRLKWVLEALAKNGYKFAPSIFESLERE